MFPSLAYCFWVFNEFLAASWEALNGLLNRIVGFYLRKFQRPKDTNGEKSPDQNSPNDTNQATPKYLDEISEDEEPALSHGVLAEAASMESVPPVKIQQKPEIQAIRPFLEETPSCQLPQANAISQSEAEIMAPGHRCFGEGKLAIGSNKASHESEGPQNSQAVVNTDKYEAQAKPPEEAEKVDETENKEKHNEKQSIRKRLASKLLSKGKDSPKRKKRVSAEEANRIKANAASSTTSIEKAPSPLASPRISLRRRGIEGRNNSCYLDSTLFSMFYYHQQFDSRFLEADLQFFKQEPKPAARDILHQLKLVVDSLRGGYCRATIVATLRQHLAQFNPRVVEEMMDVDDLIQTLFGKALQLKHFIRFANPSSNYYYQIILPAMQYRELRILSDLLKESMHFLGLKLAGMPQPAFIIKVPRSRGKLIGCSGILPELVLDIAPILADARAVENRRMYLGAVICLNSYHYTSYVRCGNQLESPWVYFNSMPASVVSVQGLGRALQEMEDGGAKRGFQGFLNSHLSRILSDIHVCIYYPMHENV